MKGKYASLSPYKSETLSVESSLEAAQFHYYIATSLLNYLLSDWLIDSTSIL